MQIAINLLIFADMNKQIRHTALLISVLFSYLCLTACNDDIPSPDKKLKGNTVIVYMGADNNLNSFSNSDLNELTSAVNDIPDNCQVIVFRDNNSNNLKPTIYHLTAKGTVTWREYEQELNSADSATVKDILQTIVGNFPSEKYSLVLWSHGTGWSDHATARQRAIIQDRVPTNHWLKVSQLAGILETLPHMEYIFFDACFMQTVEVASYLYPHTNYIIGSPVEIPANGARYDIIMKALCQADIQGIINGYASADTGGYGVPLSAVYSEEFRNFCATTAQYIPNVFLRSSMPSTNNIQIYAPQYLSGNGTIPVPYDMRSAMFHVLDSADYSTWTKQWEKTILYPVKANDWVSDYSGSMHCHLTDPDNYGAISMHIPNESYEEHGWNVQFSLTPWYSITGWKETGW